MLVIKRCLSCNKTYGEGGFCGIVLNICPHCGKILTNENTKMLDIYDKNVMKEYTEDNNE